MPIYWYSIDPRNDAKCIYSAEDTSTIEAAYASRTTVQLQVNPANSDVSVANLTPAWQMSFGKFTINTATMRQINESGGSRAICREEVIFKIAPFLSSTYR
jgi:hypothetical protein